KAITYSAKLGWRQRETMFKIVELYDYWAAEPSRILDGRIGWAYDGFGNYGEGGVANNIGVKLSDVKRNYVNFFIATS
ncbi:hypothetical protein ACW9H6_29310, partial [Pseudomonas sp. SDO528_S397]